MPSSTGKKVLYSSPWIPAEWIAAHGMEPVRIIPRYRSGGGLAGIEEGACPFMRQFVREACAVRRAAAIVLATSCDQMRRAGDLIRKECRRPVYLFHVPATCGTANSRAIFLAELRRLGDFLVSRGGNRPRPVTLRRVFEEHDDRRRQERAARRRAVSGPGRRVALVGGPLFEEDRELFSVIAATGGRVVLDGTETGERMLAAPFARRRLARDPLKELARAYGDAIPDAFRRPNRRLYDWLTRAVRSRRIEGIIVCRHLWCDIWHAEVRRIQDRFCLPVLDLDFGDEPLFLRNRTRLQAFLESLEAAAGKRTRR